MEGSRGDFTAVPTEALVYSIKNESTQVDIANMVGAIGASLMQGQGS
jgi:hypothetical protein